MRNYREIHEEENSGTKFIAYLLPVISFISIPVTAFAIIGGVWGGVLFLISLVLLMLHHRNRSIRISLLLAAFFAIVNIATAGFGLLAQYSAVRENCDAIPDLGSAEHLACFQENYSPTQGIIQTLLE